MTEEEKRMLREKIEARKQREAARNMNSNQQTCSGCGSVIPANYDVCPVCGKVLRQDVPVQNGFEQNTWQSYQQVQSVSDEPGKGFAITSVVLGGVGLLLVWFLHFLGPILGGVGYTLSDKASERGCRSDLPKIGRILSIVSMAISLVIEVVIMVLFLLAFLVPTMMIDSSVGGLFGTMGAASFLILVVVYGIPWGLTVLIGWLIKKYV